MVKYARRINAHLAAGADVRFDAQVDVRLAETTDVRFIFQSKFNSNGLKSNAFSHILGRRLWISRMTHFTDVRDRENGESTADR